jgi:hypothetical protein
MYKLSFGEKNWSLFKLRARSSSKGDNHRNVKKRLRSSKNIILKNYEARKSWILHESILT